MKPLSVLLFPVFFVCCGNLNVNDQTPDLINSQGITIETRFLVPPGYSRLPSDSSSFGYYLRNLPLKPAGTKVKLYSGEEKPFQEAQAAIVDMEIGNKDLLQCADACIRLRAEYLWKNGREEEISFELTNGFEMQYTMWAKGNRLAIEGNKTWWEKSAHPSNSYESFRKYLDRVFMYAGTLSLEKSLSDIDRNSAEAGDVLVVGGSPGHASMIVDVAVNDKTGEKIYLLAQGYMPSQDIHVINSPNNELIGPWYALPPGQLETIEWTFYDYKVGRFD